MKLNINSVLKLNVNASMGMAMNYAIPLLICAFWSRVDHMVTVSQSIKHLNATVIRIGREQTVQQRFSIVEGSEMISIRVMNGMEFVKKVKSLMVLGQESVSASLVGLVHSAMKMKMNAKLVLMRMVFKMMFERWRFPPINLKHHIENLFISVTLLMVSASMNMDHINVNVKKDLFLIQPIARLVLILTSVTWAMADVRTNQKADVLILKALINAIVMTDISLI